MTQEQKIFILLALPFVFILIVGVLNRITTARRERRGRTKKNARKPLISKRYDNIHYKDVTENKNTEVVKPLDNSFKYKTPMNAEFSPIIRKNNK